MSFNPDPSKKAQQKVFSQNVKNVFHPNLTSKNVDVGQICSQKHLGMFLDFKFQWAFRNSFNRSQQRYCYTSQHSICVTKRGCFNFL